MTYFKHLTLAIIRDTVLLALALYLGYIVVKYSSIIPVWFLAIPVMIAGGVIGMLVTNLSINIRILINVWKSHKLVTICMWCNTYLSTQTSAYDTRLMVSHGLCSECKDKMDTEKKKVNGKMKTIVSDSFSKKDLFEAFSHYAFTSISNQPYNEEELMEDFEKWFKHKYKK